MSLIIHALTKGGFVAASDRCAVTRHSDGSASYFHNYQKTYVFNNYNGLVVSFCGNTHARYDEKHNDSLTVFDFLKQVDDELKLKLNKRYRLGEFCTFLLSRYYDERDKYVVTNYDPIFDTDFLVSGPTGDPGFGFATYKIDTLIGNVYCYRTYAIKSDFHGFGACADGIDFVAKAMLSKIDWEHISLSETVQLCSDVIGATSNVVSISGNDMKGTVSQDCNIYVFDFFSGFHGWANKYDVGNLVSFCREYDDLKYDRRYHDIFAGLDTSRTDATISDHDMSEPEDPSSDDDLPDFLESFVVDTLNVTSEKDKKSTSCRPRVKKKTDAPYTK